MKRFVCMVLLGCILLSMPASSAAKKKGPARKERVVELSYASPGIGISTGTKHWGRPLGSPDAYQIELEPGERYVTMEVIDASGQPVAGRFDQEGLSYGGYSAINRPYGGVGAFCGAHSEPVKLLKRSPITAIYLFNGVCEDGTPSVMTSGTVKITLSNLP